MRDYGWRVERKGDLVTGYICDPRGGELKCAQLTEGHGMKPGAAYAFVEKNRPYYEAEIEIYERGEPSWFTCKTRDEHIALTEARMIGGVSREQFMREHDAWAKEWAL